MPATATRPRTGKAAIRPPNDIAQVAITIQGVPPGMLMDTGQRINFNGNRVKVADRRPPREQAETCLYIGVKEHKGKIVLPAENLLACLVGGGRFVKVGRRQVSTSQSSILAGALTLDQTESLVVSEGWEVLSAHPRNAAGSSSQSYMPLFTDWACSLQCSLDCSFIPLDAFRQVVDIAGRLIGLGPMRPERKRMYGRFLVTEWKLLSGST